MSPSSESFDSSLCVVPVRLRLAADLATERDVLVPLLAGLLDVAGVTGRELELLLGRDARLQLPAAFELGVELAPEQQRQVGDPQEQQRDDDARQRSVGLVVAGEVPHVEGEADRGEHPDQDRHAGTDRDPAELRLLHVGRRVVEQRDDQDDDQRQDRPLRDRPDSQRGVAEADHVADRLRHRSRDDQHQQRDGGQDDGDQGQEQHERTQLPERPALVDLVDLVHRPAEGADVPRGRPECGQDADDQRDSGALGLGDVARAP